MATPTNKISEKLKQIVDVKFKSAIEFGTKKSFLEQQAEILRKQIVKRTRLGKVVPEFDGDAKKMKGLATSTKRFRRRYSSNLDAKTSPNRSNLTATGQTLNSLRSRVLGKKIQIFIRDAPKKKLSGGVSPTVTVKDVVRFHQEGTNQMPAREFFNAARFELNILRRNIRKQILKKLGL